MYIDKWWYVYIGGSDESCTLIDYLKKDDVMVYPLSKIFKDFNLYHQMQQESFRDTQDVLFYDEDGVHHNDINIVINLIADLSAILLESLVNTEVSLKALDKYVKQDKKIKLIPTEEEFNCLIDVLEDFSISYMEYDLAQFCDEGEMQEMAAHCSEICQELKNFKG